MTPEFARNPFDLLGLPVGFAVDAARLERRGIDGEARRKTEQLEVVLMEIERHRDS